jgi:hypothetical protein
VSTISATVKINNKIKNYWKISKIKRFA